MSTPSQPPNSPPQISFFAVCDDVRVEQGSKFTLIGFYGRGVGVQALPSTFPKLSFIAQFDLPSIGGHDLVIRLINPSGGVIFESPRSPLTVPVENSPFPVQYRTSTIVFYVAPLALTESGEYTVQYELSDWPPYSLQFFVAVQLPPLAPTIAAVQ